MLQLFVDHSARWCKHSYNFVALNRHDESALGVASKVQAVPAGQDARLATIAVQVQCPLIDCQCRLLDEQ